jgi:hypothetical protein
MKTKTKTVKPIDSSISLIYCCPKCSNQHWISLKAAKTKGFIIVCDCDQVFKPKTVETIKIIYKKKNQSSKQPSSLEQNTPDTKIPHQLLDKCTESLTNYGFTKNEASILLNKAYSVHTENNPLELIKLALSLSNIGDNNEQPSNSTN